ncbi:AP2 domain transcription factor AP2VIIa-5 [Besnoitia besnoiti]|uniref:AP2 domain transcription factor AP2VIIa-5 n=1 Tax=Besnoitia besnoiti TaxID=94643 RepID=A0A2A9M7R8_BESBE|nr:AP2 domain transcription factor AP2VIIa-5 [Besnoitia besnoiti]PFH34528.1 AP2 domain transcription factor AP2VIIa-5 [Besnoitia besnoiti]
MVRNLLRYHLYATPTFLCLRRWDESCKIPTERRLGEGGSSSILSRLTFRQPRPPPVDSQVSWIARSLSTRGDGLQPLAQSFLNVQPAQRFCRLGGRMLLLKKPQEVVSSAPGGSGGVQRLCRRGQPGAVEDATPRGYLEDMTPHRPASPSPSVEAPPHAAATEDATGREELCGRPRSASLLSAEADEGEANKFLCTADREKKPAPRPPTNRSSACAKRETSDGVVENSQTERPLEAAAPRCSSSPPTSSQSPLLSKGTREAPAASCGSPPSSTLSPALASGASPSVPPSPPSWSPLSSSSGASRSSSSPSAVLCYAAEPRPSSGPQLPQRELVSSVASHSTPDCEARASSVEAQPASGSPWNSSTSPSSSLCSPCQRGCPKSNPASSSAVGREERGISEEGTTRPRASSFPLSSSSSISGSPRSPQSCAKGAAPQSTDSASCRVPSSTVSSLSASSASPSVSLPSSPASSATQPSREDSSVASASNPTLDGNSIVGSCNEVGTREKPREQPSASRSVSAASSLSSSSSLRSQSTTDRPPCAADAASACSASVSSDVNEIANPSSLPPQTLPQKSCGEPDALTGACRQNQDRVSAGRPCAGAGSGSEDQEETSARREEDRLTDSPSPFDFFPPRPSPFACTVSQQAEMFLQLLTGLARLRASFWRSPKRSHAFSFHVFQIQNAQTDKDLSPYREIFETLFVSLGLSLAHTPPVPHLADWVLLKNLPSDKEAAEAQQDKQDVRTRKERVQGVGEDKASSVCGRSLSVRRQNRGVRKALKETGCSPASTKDFPGVAAVADLADVAGPSPFAGEGTEGLRSSVSLSGEAQDERKYSAITEAVKQDGGLVLGHTLEDVYDALDRLFVNAKDLHEFYLTPTFPESLFEAPPITSTETNRGPLPTRSATSAAFATDRGGLPLLSRLRSGSLGDLEKRAAAVAAVGRGGAAGAASLSSRLSGFVPQPYGTRSFSRPGAVPALSHPDQGLRFFLYSEGLVGRREGDAGASAVFSPNLHPDGVGQSVGVDPSVSPVTVHSAVPHLVSPACAVHAGSLALSATANLPQSRACLPQDAAGAPGAESAFGAQAVSALPPSFFPASGCFLPTRGASFFRGGRTLVHGGVSASGQTLGSVAETPGDALAPDAENAAASNVSSSVSNSPLFQFGFARAAGAPPTLPAVHAPPHKDPPGDGLSDGDRGNKGAASWSPPADGASADAQQARGGVAPVVLKHGGSKGGPPAAASGSCCGLTSLKAASAATPGAFSAGLSHGTARRVMPQPLSAQPGSLASPGSDPSSHAPGRSADDQDGDRLSGAPADASSASPLVEKHSQSAQTSSGASSSSSGSAAPQDGQKAGSNPLVVEKDQAPSLGGDAAAGSRGDAACGRPGAASAVSPSGSPFPSSALPVAISLTPFQLQKLQLHPGNLALLTHLALPSSSSTLVQQAAGSLPLLVATNGNSVPLSHLPGASSTQTPASGASGFPVSPSPTGDGAAALFPTPQVQGNKAVGTHPSPFLMQTLSGFSGAGNVSPPLRTQVSPSGQLLLSYAVPTAAGGAAGLRSAAVTGAPCGAGGVLPASASASGVVGPGGLKCGSLGVPVLRFPAAAALTASGSGAGGDTAELAQRAGSESLLCLLGGQGATPAGTGGALPMPLPAVPVAAEPVEPGVSAFPGSAGGLAAAPADEAMASQAGAGGAPSKGGEESGGKDSGSVDVPASRSSPFPLFQLFRNGWWATPIPPEDPPLSRDETEALLPFLPSVPAVVYCKEQHCFFALWRMKDGVVQRRRCECSLLGVREAHRQAVQTVCRLTRRPPGVVYDCKSGKWSVCVTRHNGRHRASFSVKKFGFEGAHEKAMDWYEAKRVQLGLHDNPTCAEVADFEADVKANPSALFDVVRKALDAAPPAQPVRAGAAQRQGEKDEDKKRKDSTKAGNAEATARSPGSAAPSVEIVPVADSESKIARLPLVLTASAAVLPSSSAEAGGSVVADRGNRSNAKTLPHEKLGVKDEESQSNEAACNKGACELSVSLREPSPASQQGGCAPAVARDKGLEAESHAEVDPAHNGPEEQSSGTPAVCFSGSVGGEPLTLCASLQSSTSSASLSVSQSAGSGSARSASPLASVPRASSSSVGSPDSPQGAAVASASGSSAAPFSEPLEPARSGNVSGRSTRHASLGGVLATPESATASEVKGSRDSPTGVSGVAPLDKDAAQPSSGSATTASDTDATVIATKAMLNGGGATVPLSSADVSEKMSPLAEREEGASACAEPAQAEGSLPTVSGSSDVAPLSTAAVSHEENALFHYAHATLPSSLLPHSLPPIRGMSPPSTPAAPCGADASWKDSEGLSFFKAVVENEEDKKGETGCEAKSAAVNTVHGPKPAEENEEGTQGEEARTKPMAGLTVKELCALTASSPVS